ncbi:MAG: acetyl coenzyme A synthetase (ADP forming), alpha domain protein [Candidatus Accumulibacter adjunctus]|uniref:Acetyl coenzyme A synthetase (ADP forming), alpha domain protein n=1 Tax=Candidatus Accumulibacter adjunctus TaxID=1454001 RepID=A0A011NWI4_9PROT|nr:MAG: acetyl coenzyme A synthetase (ADP forming), alpha domain protein [Candidatus Accumulibacter adjunctus]
MTVRNLEFLFRPASVAIVAEPDEASRYAEVVRSNLAGGCFSGPVMSVVARQRKLLLLPAGVRLDPLAAVPDLAVICASLDKVPSIIEQLGNLGTRAVVVGPWLWHRMHRNEIAAAQRGILAAARPFLMRVLGPGSGGLVVPAQHLNASAAPVAIAAGKIALVTHSTAMTAAILDRACSKDIGFSTVLHLGSGLDVDLADVLDWLAGDGETKAILVQFDTVPAGRKFMSAARAAARHKPVVAIRGRSLAGDSNPAFPPDEVYEAALRRAGWVSVDTLGGVFEAIEGMARMRPLRGERLTILANGHGLGRIAGETLLRSGGKLGKLSRETSKRLEGLLQTRSSLANPIALPADVTVRQWAAALACVLADSGTQNVLTVCSPSPFAPGPQVAEAICKVSRESERNVFTCWVGGKSMLAAQRVAAEHGVISHESPERAIAVFLGVLSYLHNRRLLLQLPASRAEDFAPDLAAARSAVGEAVAARAGSLSVAQARRLLAAYGIVLAAHPVSSSIEAAILAADEVGYPVDLALVGGGSADCTATAVDLRSPADIRLAARGLRGALRTQQAAARVGGYRVRPSAARSGAPPLRFGVAVDAVFGPLILFGPAARSGASAGRVVVALPPLNLTLARDLVARSGILAKLPDESRSELQTAASQALVRLSQLLTDNDEVVSVELDPLHVERNGVFAIDAGIGIASHTPAVAGHRFAIRPYPKELEQPLEWQGRRLSIRPIRPEDESLLGELLHSLAPEDSRMRFFDAIRSLPRVRLARFAQIDYDREMALVAIENPGAAGERVLGEVRAVSEPGKAVADFAIVVASEIKGMGLGAALLQSLVRYCRSEGIGELRGETLDGNLRMQGLARKLGFEQRSGADRGTVDLRLTLGGSAAA